MRSTFAAALAATALVAAGVATAGAASAESAPAPGTKRAGDAQLLQHSAELRSVVTAGGNVRLSGNSRYETAAEISKFAWDPEHTLIVTLASGTALPDALAWGGTGAGVGPTLLTERDRLPEATRAELQRLTPCYLIVLGGTPSVSDAVVAEAERYTDPSLCASL